MTYKMEGTDFGEFSTPVSLGTGISLDDIENHRYLTPKGDISFKEHKIQPHFSILEGRYSLQDDVHIFGKGDSALLEIQFNLSDRDIHFQNKSQQQRKTLARSGNITYLNEEENQAHILFQKDVAYDTFDIHLPASILQQYAGESNLMDRFLENINKGISSTLNEQNVAVDSNVYNTILDIKNCRFEGLTKRIYLESKAYELIALLFNAAENQNKHQQLNHSDQEKIHHAASVIRHNLEKPFTIVELSRVVGINQTKLKYGFKTVFNNTVFGYLQDIRMHQAKKYLLDTQMSIQEIAMRVGYQNMSNFSAAFKKHFGVSPIKLKEK